MPMPTKRRRRPKSQPSVSTVAMRKQERDEKKQENDHCRRESQRRQHRQRDDLRCAENVRGNERCHCGWNYCSLDLQASNVSNSHKEMSNAEAELTSHARQRGAGLDASAVILNPIQTIGIFGRHLSPGHCL